MAFVNRVKEVEAWQALLDSGAPHLALLYGRRRLGKTALLRELRERYGGLYFQVPDQAEEGILRHLNDRLHEQVGRPIEYRGLADFLRDLGGHGARFIVLDEVQRLFDAVPASASWLQEAWDTRLKDQGLVVALCGSVIGTMASLLEAKSPLYGRITYSQHLPPFTYAGVRAFYPESGEGDILERYAVFGATPHYHDVSLHHETLREAIRQCFLVPGAPLRDEPRTLFSIEFQRPERYQEILEAMGRGAQTLGAVAGRYGRKASDYTAYLAALQDRLRIVADADPVGGKKKRKRIAFTDPFFRFYYRFIYPNLDRIELGDEEGVLADIEAGLPQLLGDVWETVCRQWMIAQQGVQYGDHVVRFRALGSWWDGEEELDVVALGDDAAYCGECKYRSTAMDRGAVERFVARSRQVQQANRRGELLLFIWSRSGLTPEARQLADEIGIHVLAVEETIQALATP